VPIFLRIMSEEFLRISASLKSVSGVIKMNCLKNVAISESVNKLTYIFLINLKILITSSRAGQFVFVYFEDVATRKT